MPRPEPFDCIGTNVITAGIPVQLDECSTANPDIAQKPIIVSRYKLNSRLHQGAADIAVSLPLVAFEIGAVVRFDPGTDRIPADSEIVPDEFAIAFKP